MNDVSKFSNLKIQNGKKVIKKKLSLKILLKKTKVFFYTLNIKNTCLKVLMIIKTEYFAKLFKDKIIIIIGNKIFN